MGLRKHPLYWFDDGSLILHIQDVLFRLHYSLLKRHSPYLASVDNVHPIESIPIVNDLDKHSIYIRVGEDRRISTRDVEALLEHMYHDFPLSPDSSFERIASVLRSSSPQQLDMPGVHAKARGYLDAIFAKKMPSDIDPTQLQEALFIAKTFRLLSVLKIVLYQAMVSSDLDLDDDTPPPSNTTFLDPPSFQSPFNSGSSGPLVNGERLTEADMQLCKRLMTRVIDHFTPILFTPATTPHMACTDVFADTWMDLVISPALEDDGVYKPIETLERLKQIEWAQRGLCAECMKDKREEWTGEQESIWALVEKWLEEESIV